MKIPPYIKLRGGQWWYRRRVPEALVPVVGRAEFRESLRTADVKRASTAAAIRNAEVEVQFEAARAQLRKLNIEPSMASTPLDGAILDYIRDAVRSHVMQEDERVRMARPGADDLEEYEQLRSAQFDDAGSALKSGRVGLSDVDKQRIDVALQSVGVSLPRQSPSWEDAAFRATEGLLQALQGIRERMRGEYLPTPPMPAKPQALDVTVPVPGKGSTLRLGEVIAEYKAGLVQNEFRRKVVRCLDLFESVVGAQTPVQTIKQKAVTGFLRDICRIPVDWAKLFDKGATMVDLLALDADRVMGPTTFSDNYRAPLGTFLTVAFTHHGDEGFPNLTVKHLNYIGTREAEEGKQRALRPDELPKLFEGDVFQAIARDPSQESLYWMSAALLFTGARPRELCQVNPQADFGQADGQWFLDFSERTAPGKSVKKSIKTGEARRIPLHPELLRLGFTEYLQRLKDAGADRLFPDFNVKGGNPYKGEAQASFTELLKSTGLYTRDAAPGENVTGAYVMRKTFITMCRNQGVTSKEITGHSDGTTTEIQDKHYISGPEPLLRKAEQMARLVMPVTIPTRIRKQGSGVLLESPIRTAEEVTIESTHEKRDVRCEQ